MVGINLEPLLNEPIYASDFQSMIGDVEDFIDFSEANIDWQYRRELQAIGRKAEIEEFPDGYREHLETNAEHRFKVSLPLRVRYGAVIALTTSVEWAVGFLVKRLKEPLAKTSDGQNFTVNALFQLNDSTSLGKVEVVQDYEAIVHIRNCIAHSAGIGEHYRHRDRLPAAIARLTGFSLANWHCFGTHICIDRGALNPYVRDMGNMIVAIHKTVHEQGLLHDAP